MFDKRSYIIICAIIAVTIAMVSFTNNSDAAVNGKPLNNKSAATANKSVVTSSDENKSKAVEKQSNNAQKQPEQQDDKNKPFADILKEKGITDPSGGMKIVVSKSSHTLSLVYNGTSLKSYNVELGEGGLGDKEVEGDLKTPEGTFYVTDKRVMDPADYYLGSRWLGISYPNTEDADRGLKQGLIDSQTYSDIVDAFNNKDNPPQDTSLGGNIGIHGGSIPIFGSNWTWGCVGLTNADIEEFYDYVSVGTPIVIQK